MSSFAQKIKTLKNINLKWAVRYYSKKVRMYAQYWFSSLIGRTYFTAVIDGTRIKLAWLLPYQHLYAYQESRGMHEPTLLLKWKKEAEHAQVIFDCGGYNGMYGLLAAAANPSAKVYIFEPSPGAAENIQKNIAINNFSNIIFVPKAVGGTVGTQTFTNDGAGSAGALSNKGTITVETTTLTSYEPPDLIKLDIVGAEYDALTAARTTLTTRAVKIFLELYPQNKEKLLPFLQELGYTTEFLYPRADGGVEYYFVSKS